CARHEGLEGFAYW
nr:immunoglobulin heavy chain junction region [Mus musculus]NSM08250.1 immunoglobulin heavy chain junction region [Mus musculus]NSM09115.1 immunoglobulin heavy chain junction region [Mus musculus]NSM09199.1 immunoglobulin heavy chain junction region [Mus musculus]NSM09285.1 immunoglobulin heavy chain junction region [Mus musculus]